MILFCDTSALIKLYIREDFSDNWSRCTCPIRPDDPEGSPPSHRTRWPLPPAFRKKSLERFFSRLLAMIDRRIKIRGGTV